MFIHIFAFRLKAGITEEQKDHIIAAICELPKKIPGLLETHIGRNLSPRAAGYELGGVMRFPDAAAFTSYNSHSAHQELLQWLLPLIEPIEIDFEA